MPYERTPPLDESRLEAEAQLDKLLAHEKRLYQDLVRAIRKPSSVKDINRDRVEKLCELLGQTRHRAQVQAHRLRALHQDEYAAQPVTVAENPTAKVHVDMTYYNLVHTSKIEQRFAKTFHNHGEDKRWKDYDVKKPKRVASFSL